MASRSARRPLPALVFLLALAILAVIVWVRVADRDSGASDAGGAGCASAPQLPSNQAVTVTVLNGTQKNGLAQAVLNAFVQYGFTGGSIGDADTADSGIGSITYGPNGAASALLASYYLPGATLQTDTRQDTGVTVEVGDQFVALAPADQVAAALAKATVSQSPAPNASPTGAGGTGGTGGAGGTGGTGASASPAPTATCTTTPPAPTPSGAAPSAPAS